MTTTPKHTPDTQLFIAALAARLAVIRAGATWPVSALDLATLAVEAYGEDAEVARLLASNAELVAAVKQLLSFHDAWLSANGAGFSAMNQEARAALRNATGEGA